MSRVLRTVGISYKMITMGREFYGPREGYCNSYPLTEVNRQRVERALNTVNATSPVTIQILYSGPLYMSWKDYDAT